ncbi:hypothetical protein IFDJLNFL_4951 [Methylobacterium dankookense]|jgi:hypothetical protein|uniref:Uncharacterized protein n=1 Tax=Methylobacterium dankookense TaxID=560405 RepID=A0ABQ4RMJ0_9HYPH|nr:hypothetical protein IFDJLNFL_4951 [Methylobacterium dankookense]
MAALLAEIAKVRELPLPESLLPLHTETNA